MTLLDQKTDEILSWLRREFGERTLYDTRLHWRAEFETYDLTIWREVCATLKRSRRRETAPSIATFDSLAAAIVRHKFQEVAPGVNDSRLRYAYLKAIRTGEPLPTDDERATPEAFIRRLAKTPDQPVSWRKPAEEVAA